MPKPVKKGKTPKVTSPWGTTPGARNVPFTIRPDPTLGTPLQRPLTGTPGGTPLAGRLPSGVKPPWWKPTGAGLGGLGRLASLGGRFTPWGAAATGIAMGGTELWKMLTPEFQAYKDTGGVMGQLEWQREGRPSSDDILTDRARKALEGLGEDFESLSNEEKVARMQDYFAAQTALYQTYKFQGGTLSEEDWRNAGSPSTPSAQELSALPPETPMEKAQRELIEARTREIGKPPPRETFEEWGEDPGENWYFNPNTGKWEFLPPEGYISPGEQERMNLEREVFDWQQLVRGQEMEAEKGRQLAQLRASPSSWLEYASLAGQTPAIQSWMLPLMPQQYGQLQAGGAIPGYQAGGEKMNLPQLTTPSAQYMSRISPSARQQYYGYEVARTGQSAADVDWRLWSQAPPSGRYQGLRRMR